METSKRVGARDRSAMHQTLFYLIKEEKIRQIALLLEKGYDVNIQNNHLQVKFIFKFYLKSTISWILYKRIATSTSIVSEIFVGVTIELRAPIKMHHFNCIH